MNERPDLNRLAGCVPSGYAPGDLDPRVLYQFAQPGSRPLRATYKLEANFSGTNAIGTQTQVQLTTPMSQDFWVEDMTSVVELAQANAGNILGPQFEYYRGLTPGIDVQLKVQGGGVGQQYVINDTLTPLVQVAPPANNNSAKSFSKCANYTLAFSQTIFATMVLKRSYEGLGPLRVVITLSGWQLQCSNFGGMTPQQANDLLLRMLVNPRTILDDPRNPIQPGR
jgi:hypothetical protein